MKHSKNIPSKIKRGDLVEVIAGRDKGKRGKVIEMFRVSNRAIVEGIHLVKHHVRPTQNNPQGGIVSKPSSIHLSNIMIVDPKEDRPTRIGMKLINSENTATRYVRLSKLSGEIIDQ